jgi:hypothetical protein
MLPLVTTKAFEQALDPYRAVRSGAGAALLAGTQESPPPCPLRDGLESPVRNGVMMVVGDQVEAPPASQAWAWMGGRP